jgi:hypothetical protein
VCLAALDHVEDDKKIGEVIAKHFVREIEIVFGLSFKAYRLAGSMLHGLILQK